jgi:membrane protein YdbS with pleckstrin-like domain
MSYPDRLLTEGEKIVSQFRPHWRLLLIPVLWVIAAIAAIVLYIQFTDFDNDIVNLVVVAVIVAALIPLTVAPLVKWWFTSYILTNERLITRRGVLARSGIEIPLENINDVSFTQNVLERVLRSGDVLIESAGEAGQSRFTDIPDPEGFQSLLYRTRELRSGIGADEPAAPVDPTERLARLAQLHRDGVITDEEFESKKQSLLDEI